MPRIRQYTSEARTVVYRLLRENPLMLEQPAADMHRKLTEIGIKVDASLVRRFIRDFKREVAEDAETRLEPASPGTAKDGTVESHVPANSTLAAGGTRGPLVVGYRAAELASLRSQALDLAVARWPNLDPQVAKQRGAILFSLVRGSTRDAARKAARVKPDAWEMMLRDPEWLEEVEQAEGEAINIAADRLHSASDNPAYWFAALRWLERRTREFAPMQTINVNQRIEGEFDIKAIFARPDAAKVIEQISYIEAELQEREAEAKLLPPHRETES
jgi:hypothetical protein